MLTDLTQVELWTESAFVPNSEDRVHRAGVTFDLVMDCLSLEPFFLSRNVLLPASLQLETDPLNQNGHQHLDPLINLLGYKDLMSLSPILPPLLVVTATPALPVEFAFEQVHILFLLCLRLFAPTRLTGKVVQLRRAYLLNNIRLFLFLLNQLGPRVIVLVLLFLLILAYLFILQVSSLLLIRNIL